MHLTSYGFFFFKQCIFSFAWFNFGLLLKPIFLWWIQVLHCFLILHQIPTTLTHSSLTISTATRFTKNSILQWASKQENAVTTIGPLRSHMEVSILAKNQLNTKTANLKTQDCLQNLLLWGLPLTEFIKRILCIYRENKRNIMYKDVLELKRTTQA